MKLTYRHATAAITALAIGACLAPATALARPAGQPAASIARACHNHAGKIEGDGEYTDGAMVNAVGISCKRALAIVKPRYHWLYAHFEHAYHHGWRFGVFSCHMELVGPDDVKHCVDHRRSFTFL
jgi:hypothetical protein